MSCKIENVKIEPEERIIAEDEGYMLGIDEAGRGPVLGAMVYGTCYCPIAKIDALKAMGFADSKQLTAEEREKLFQDIKDCKFMGWLVDVISPQDMSAKMLRRQKYNLNSISHDSAIGLIRSVLAKGINVREVYVDTVGDPQRYQEKLKGIFPEIDIVVSKKADSLFPIVSAASICAKVTRDHALENWQFKEEAGMKVNRVLGSGYPGDQVTKDWLSDHFDEVFGFPSLVRFAWSTCDVILQKRGRPVEWDDNEGAEGERISHFFQQTSSKTEISKAKRYKYFQEREMGLVSNFKAPAS